MAGGGVQKHVLVVLATVAIALAALAALALSLAALKDCSPFDLPAEKYEIWQSFTLRFVPRRPS